MPTAPRVVVIDDEKSHLEGLADTLDRHGVPCHRIHYTGARDALLSCPDTRPVIADLHLGGGVPGADPTTDFGILGTLLEEVIRPPGPYAILAWTEHPDLAPRIQEFLGRLHRVPKPAVVAALSRADHFDDDGHVRNEDALNRQIDEQMDGWIRPRGALALVGLWGELEDEEMDAFIEEVYAARRRGLDRCEERRG